MVVFGSLNLDLGYGVERFPQPGETVLGHDLRRSPGGKGGNQAHAAARTADEAIPTTMVACVGNDEAGVFLRRTLAEAGVDTSDVREVTGASGTALIAVDASGENTIVVVAGANAAWPDDLVSSVVLGPGDVVVCQLEVALETVRAIVRHATSAGARVVLNAAPVDPGARDLLDAVDILVVNETEAGELLGLDRFDVDVVTAARRELPCDLVVTLGRRGAVVATRNEPARIVPAFPVDAVDSVGAGDAFVGALASSLAAGAALAEAARSGNAAGALTATVPGARHATLTPEKIREFIMSCD